RKTVQEELDRRRTAIFPDEHCRMIGAVPVLAAVRVFAARAVERLDARFVVRTADPAVACTEAESWKVGRVLDGVDRRQQGRRVDAVSRFLRWTGGGNQDVRHVCPSF